MNNHDTDAIANDNVNHPSHYCQGRIEVIDYIEDVVGIEGLRAVAIGNALKYLSRSGKKDPKKDLEDIEKAAWYLTHYIERAKETANNG